MADLPRIEKFVSSTGVRIYRIPCLAFPNFVAYTYLLLGAGPITLVDTGSNFGECTRHILDGIASLRGLFGEAIRISDVERILITHGHVDHFGGLAEIKALTGAPVGVHVLDRRVLTAHNERVVVATRSLRGFLERAGVDSENQPRLIEMYGFSKKHVIPTPIDFLLEEDMDLDGIKVIHAPGHCPGQVCFGIGDVLLSADHILEKTTPHQAPESITPFTGLGHYVDSLAKVQKLPGYIVALGGHEGPIHDVYQRIEDILSSHARKLERLMSLLDEAPMPLTMSEITVKMYPRAQGFHHLLALEEAGAHVEFLYERGDLAVVNLDEVEREINPPLRFVRA